MDIVGRSKIPEIVLSSSRGATKECEPKKEEVKGGTGNSEPHREEKKNMEESNDVQTCWKTVSLQWKLKRNEITDDK